MVDYQNSVDPSAAPAEANGAGETKQGFMASRVGKLVVGGVAVLLVLAAIAAAVYFFVIGGGAQDGATDLVSNPVPAAAPLGSDAATATPVEPVERSLASTFTFRNIFAPTVKRSFEVAAESSTDTSGANPASVPSNTLFLVDIAPDESGVEKAVFIWNDQTYVVGEGAQVGTSPWKVLQINADSVLMLYGDSQVTLSVGQGVGK